MFIQPTFHDVVIYSVSVTQDDKPVLTTGEIIGIVIGGTSALLAVPGVYFGFKQWSRRKRNVKISWSLF
jgi:hypothetical protein